MKARNLVIAFTLICRTRTLSSTVCAVVLVLGMASTVSAGILWDASGAPDVVSVIDQTTTGTFADDGANGTWTYNSPVAGQTTMTSTNYLSWGIGGYFTGVGGGVVNEMTVANGWFAETRIQTNANGEGTFGLGVEQDFFDNVNNFYAGYFPDRIEIRNNSLGLLLSMGAGQGFMTGDFNTLRVERGPGAAMVDVYLNGVLQGSITPSTIASGGPGAGGPGTRFGTSTGSPNEAIWDYVSINHPVPLIPEPSSATLALVGLVVLPLIRRRGTLVRK